MWGLLSCGNILLARRRQPGRYKCNSSAQSALEQLWRAQVLHFGTIAIAFLQHPPIESPLAD